MNNDMDFNNQNDISLLSDKIISLENTLNQITNSINDLQVFKNKFAFVNPEYLNIKLYKDKINILLIGFYGGSNVGDELMLETLIDYFEMNDNIHLTVMLANNLDYNILQSKFKNISIIHYCQTFNDFKILANYYDKLVVGGGALLDDSNYNLIYGCEVSLSSIVIGLSNVFCELNKEVYWLSLSSNRYISNEQFIIDLKNVVPKLKYFSLRDKNSFDTLKLIGLDVNNIKLDHDIVLANNIFKNLSLKKDNNIGIILISNDKFLSFYVNFINKLITYLESKHYNDFKINLIPFYDYCHFDLKFIKELSNLINSKYINILPFKDNMKDIYKLFVENKYIISMRYHSSLVSMINNNNLISIYDDSYVHYYNKMSYIHSYYSNDDLLLAYSEFDDNFDYDNLFDNLFLKKKNFFDNSFLNVACDNMNKIMELICR